MSQAQYEQAIKSGAEIVQNLHKEGTNIIGFGEMGIGNTSAASLIMSYLLDIPIEKCIGRGTGLDDQGLSGKEEILTAVQKKHGALTDVPTVLQAVGGFEIVMMMGAMLQAAALKKMTILVDGFIASSAMLAAQRLYPAVLDYAIFSHCSQEQGHQLMLEAMGANPLLNLNMRLGEGTGCATAYPLIVSSLAFLNGMASFESAGVSEK